MKNYFPAALALILGIVLSYAAFRTVSLWEDERIGTEFERHAGNLSSALQHGLDHHFEALYSLRSFYEGSVYVDRMEFRTFLGDSVERRAGFQALEWIPRVRADEIEYYRTLAVEDGYRDFQITELVRGGIRPASERDEYYPVFYIEPGENDEDMIGFDFASHPDYLEAMHQARDSGELVITRQLRQSHRTNDLPAFYVFLPVYSADNPMGTVEDRREALDGYLSGFFVVKDMVTASLEGLDISGIGMSLHDLSTEGSEKHLFYSSSHQLNITICLDDAQQRYSHMIRTVTFEVGGHEWGLECFRTEEFMKAQTTWTKWGVLLVGLIFTIALAAYLVRSSARKLELESLIDERKKAETELEHRMCDLSDRYKELNCIHAITKLSSQSGMTVQRMGESAVGIIPWSLKYPEIACTRITLDQSSFTTENFRESEWCLAREIIIDGINLGLVEIYYLEERPDLYEGPFLKEERDLIDLIATKLGGFIGRKQSEDEIMQQKNIAEMESQKLRSMIEGMEEGVIVADADDVIIEVNRWILNITGTERNEVIGKKVWEFHSEACLADLRPVLDAFRSNVQTIGMIFYKECFGLSISLRLQPIFNGDIYFGVILNAIDVSSLVKTKEKAETVGRELAEANRRLKERTSQLESIFEASPMGIFLVSAENRMIVKANTSGLVMLGRTRDDYMGSQCHELFYNETVEGGSIFNGESGVCEKEAWITRPDGTEIKLVEKSVRVTINGEPHVLVVLTDVTEREKAARETARLASIVKQATELILITDTDGVIEYVNPAFESVSGYQLHEVTGLKTNELIGDNDTGEDNFNSNFQSLISSGIPWTGHLMRKKKDGSTFQVEESIFPVVGQKGDIISYVSIARDVSEHLALEMQLRQSQKLESIGQLAAGIAHEINTPMQYIGDNTRFLLESFSDLIALIQKYNEVVDTAGNGEIDGGMLSEIEALAKKSDIAFLTDEIPQAINQSLDGINRVSEIVGAMKDFSHPGSESMVVTNLNRAITSTVTVARNEWKYVSDLETDLDESLPGVPCFPGEINQVILNLITNAAHAIGKKLGDNSAQKGKITIKTELAGKFAVIRISDSGTGIPQDIWERVFDPFFTTKEVGKGTGQGLSIAHAVITEKHGGEITFETVQDEGTTFIIRLPVDSDEAEGEAETEEVIQVERSG